jgi:hypothetical protein
MGGEDRAYIRRSLKLSNVLPVLIASISAIPAKDHRGKKRGLRVLSER